MLAIAAYVELAVCWVAWSLAFVRPRKHAVGAKKAVSAPASRWGILLVMLGYACIWAFVRPMGFEKSSLSLIWRYRKGCTGAGCSAVSWPAAILAT